MAFQLLYQKNGLNQEAFGYSAAGAGDVNGDGYSDFIVGNYRASPGGLFEAGAVYVYSGADGTLLYEVDGDSAGDWFGYSLAGIGDIDGDGKSDWIGGAPHCSPNGIFRAGSAFVFSGSTGAKIYRKDGEATLDYFGSSVAGAGDVNADGWPDFIIGATNTNPGGVINAGSAFVYSGTDASLLYRKDGRSGSEFFGLSVAGVGDGNGDGHADFIVGAPYAEDSSSAQSFNSGAAFVYSGLDGSLLFSVLGGKEDDNLGYSVSGAGDVNGDGRSDFIVGAPHFNVIGPPDSGTAIIYSGLDGSPLYTVHGGLAGDYFGASVAGAGDIDGDGKADVVVGAFGAKNGSQPQAGSVALISGADGTRMFQLNGAGAYEEVGVLVAGAGDINGDGHADFIIGAPGADSGRGEVFIYGLVSTAAAGEKSNRPTRLELGQNYPNPFNPATTIRFYLPERKKIVLEIFNLTGQRVKRLLEGEESAGEHTLAWDGRDARGRILPSGVYFYRLRGNNFSETKKMLLLK